MCQRSAWAPIIFLLMFFMILVKYKPDSNVYPILTFCWDIPAALLLRNRRKNT